MPVVRLHHGTTRHRAEHLAAVGPDSDFVEPGGDRYSRAEGFSTIRADSPDLGLGTAEDYARMKARNFPAEGGPAVLEIDVPEAILEIVLNDPIGAIAAASGDVRFEPGVGLEELRQAWPSLPKRVILL